MNRLFPSSLFLLAIAIVGVVFLTNIVENQERQITDKKLMDNKGKNQGHKVLDCSGDKGSCEYRFIEINNDDCKPGDSSCKKTKEVNLITDEYNHIPSPFTDEKFNVELIDVELVRPWDLEFLPDGSMLVTEQIGKIIHIKNNTSRIVYHLEPMAIKESGLLGMAMHPDFSSNGYVYIYYTYQLDNSDLENIDPEFWLTRKVFNKVSRLTFKNGRLNNEIVLLDKNSGSDYAFRVTVGVWSGR